MASLELGTGLGPCSSGDIERLDAIITELRVENEDLRERNDSLAERVAQLEAEQSSGKLGGGVGPLSPKKHKSVVDSKAVMNLAELSCNHTPSKASAIIYCLHKERGLEREIERVAQFRRPLSERIV